MNCPKTITDHLRESLIRTSSLLTENAPIKLAVTEWSDIFETLMRNRLIMGAIRFGGLKKVKRQLGCSVFHIEYIQRKLEEYIKTGNTEMLVDIANLCLVEFETGDHPRKHFKAIERKE